MTKPAEDKQYNKAWNEASNLLGGGLVKQAADTIKSTPYRMHVQEAKALGEKPMSPEDFNKNNK